LAYAWENSAQVHSTAISQSQPPGPWKSSVPVNTHQFTFHSFALSSTPNFNGAAQRPSPIQTGPTEMLSTSISGSQSFSTPVFRGGGITYNNHIDPSVDPGATTIRPTAASSSSFPNGSDSTVPVLTDGTPEAFHNCSATLSELSGFIVSPLYPAFYPNNADCVWTMSLGSIHQIILSFNTLALDYYDVLLVYDNSTDNGSLILSRTGHCASDFFSNCPESDFHSFKANGFRLQFKSDGFGTGQGFNITYQIQQIG
jgi:hypothetical protein